jgi:hypothetical protein
MRMKKFWEFKDLFKSDKEYWQELRSAYMQSSNTRYLQKEIKALYNLNRPSKNELMSTKEIKRIEELP